MIDLHAFLRTRYWVEISGIVPVPLFKYSMNDHPYRGASIGRLIWRLEIWWLSDDKFHTSRRLYTNAETCHVYILEFRSWVQFLAVPKFEESRRSMLQTMNSTTKSSQNCAKEVLMGFRQYFTSICATNIFSLINNLWRAVESKDLCSKY